MPIVDPFESGGGGAVVDPFEQKKQVDPFESQPSGLVDPFDQQESQHDRSSLGEAVVSMARGAVSTPSSIVAAVPTILQTESNIGDRLLGPLNPLRIAKDIYNAEAGAAQKLTGIDFPQTEDIAKTLTEAGGRGLQEIQKALPADPSRSGVSKFVTQTLPEAAGGIAPALAMGPAAPVAIGMSGTAGAVNEASRKADEIGLKGGARDAFIAAHGVVGATGAAGGMTRLAAGQPVRNLLRTILENEGLLLGGRAAQNVLDVAMGVPGAKLSDNLLSDAAVAAVLPTLIHAATAPMRGKAPVIRAEFERSFQKRVEFALRNGIDASDPAVQAKIASEAYVDANRAIFMQRNVVSDLWNNLISMLEKSKKYPVAGEIGARVARFLAPVVTVPTNIVGETATMATGTITSSARLLWAMRNGMESLRPTEATLAGLKPHERAARILEGQKQSNLIMRNMAKGSIGLALMALGFLNPQGAGGYYQPGEKRKPGDVKAGGFRIYGWDVPRWLTHAPAFEAIQIGATMRRVLEHHTKQDPDGPGIPLSAWAAAMGLVQEIPIIDESARLGEAASNPGKFFGDMAVNTIVPQAVQFAARQTDQRDGETIKRNPTTTGEYLKTGIPVLRQTVPEKPVKMRIIR